MSIHAINRLRWAIDGSIDYPAQSIDCADCQIARDIYIYIYIYKIAICLYVCMSVCLFVSKCGLNRCTDQPDI